MAKKIVKNKYIALLTNEEDPGIAITGHSVEEVLDGIKDYINDNMDLDEDEVVDYITDEHIEIYTTMPDVLLVTAYKEVKVTLYCLGG